MLFGTANVSDLSLASTNSTAEKNCRNRVNTRENGHARARDSLWLPSVVPAQGNVPLAIFWGCSFSLLKVSQKCSQLIHMRFVAAFASGLETRNPFRNRQEKNEFNFFGREKIFLTRKRKRACRGRTKKD